MSKGHVLFVEDDVDVADTLRIYFTLKDYEVTIAKTGGEGLDQCRRKLPHVIVLDIMLPDMDGYEVCRRLRSHRRTSHVPIIFLTQKDERTDKIAGLSLGADDYVTKPFGMRELLARIHAVLRRAEKTGTPVEILRAGSIELDRGTHTVKVNDKPVDLTPSEFELLAALMAAPRRVFSRSELLEALHPEEAGSLGGAIEGIERTIDVHVRNLRTKIEVDASNPRYIETIFGVGYRFNGDSSAVED